MPLELPPPWNRDEPPDRYRKAGTRLGMLIVILFVLWFFVGAYCR